MAAQRQLVEYLGYVYKLEKELYIYQQLESRYNQAIQSATPKEYTNVQITCGRHSFGWLTDYTVHGAHLYDGKNWYSPPAAWQETKEYKSLVKREYNKKKRIRYSLAAAAIMIFLAVAFGFLNKALGMDGLLGEDVIKTINMVLYISPILAYIFIYALYGTIKKHGEGKYEQEWLDYYKKMYQETYSGQTDTATPKIEKLKQNKQRFVITPRKQTEELLQKVYAMNVIFPKYRKFVAITQIYEYILSGRCYELQGPDGAYNLYESELRQNIIIDKLDEISSKIDALNNTMNMMVSAVNESNRLLNSMSKSLENIAENTSMISFNTSNINRHTEIMAKYNI